MDNRKIIVFGSELCKDCIILSRKLDENSVKYTYASITENLSNMKVFLDYRDRLPMFDEVKKAGSIGIPFVVIKEDGKETYAFDLDPADFK